MTRNCLKKTLTARSLPHFPLQPKSLPEVIEDFPEKRENFPMARAGFHR
jgi:hypothetical protein